jgi:hypothetical protein
MLGIGDLRGYFDGINKDFVIAVGTGEYPINRQLIAAFSPVIRLIDAADRYETKVAVSPASVALVFDFLFGKPVDFTTASFDCLLLAADLAITNLLERLSPLVEASTSEASFHERLALIQSYPPFSLPLLRFLSHHPELFDPFRRQQDVTPDLASLVLQHCGPCFADEDSKLDFVLNAAARWRSIPATASFNIDGNQLSEVVCYRLITHPLATELERAVPSFGLIQMQVRLTKTLQLELADAADANRELRRQLEERLTSLDQIAQQRDAGAQSLMLAQHESVKCKFYVNKLVQIIRSLRGALDALQQAGRVIAEFDGIMKPFGDIAKKVVELLGTMNGVRNFLYPGSGPSAATNAKKMSDVAENMKMVLAAAQCQAPCLAEMAACFREAEESLAWFFPTGQARP